MGECFFWYRPTQVVPDQRPLNGCVCVCVCPSVRLSRTGVVGKRLDGSSRLLMMTTTLCQYGICCPGVAKRRVSVEPFTQLSTSFPDFSSFQSSSVTLQLSHSKLSVFNIYRPPSSSTYSNHSLFSSMTSVLFSRLLQPLPMNLSSPVTSTFISIIL